MTKYKFICESVQEDVSWDNHPNTRVEYTVDAVDLSDMLEAFQYFLRGCGFNPDGELDFIEEEGE